MWPGKADRIAELRHDVRLLGAEHEILVAHDLRDGGDHLRRQSRRERGDFLRRRIFGEKPVAKFADRHMRDGRESCRIMGIDDEARDVVRLVGNDRLR